VPPQTPAPTKTWQAKLAGKAGFPADAQIAVSSTHVIVGNRQQMRYYDKDGSPLGNAISAASFFAPLNLKDGAGNSIDRFNDVRLIFDSYRKCFWVVATAGSSKAATAAPGKRRSYIAVGVSVTENPLDDWHRYYWDGAAQQGDSSSSIWKPGDAPDYPFVGIDPVAITTTNQVNDVNGNFKYWHVSLYPADSLAGGQFESGWQYWDLKQPDGSAPGKVAPAVHHGSPKGGRAYWVSRQGADSLVVWAITNPFKPTRKLVSVAVPMPSAWGKPVEGQQKGSSKLIEFTNLGNDPLKAVFRNEFLHVVTNDVHDWGGIGKPRTSIRYIRLPVSNFPKVSKPPASGGVSRTFGGGSPLEKIAGLKYYGWPAVEANKDGNAVIGYARTGEEVYPEVRASAYMSNEDDIRPSRLLKAGDKPYDNQYYPAANAVLPWADTAGASVDPSDDTGIWVAQEYASSSADPNGNGNYEIWVAKLFGS
jgi:hypothetical protein